MLVLSRQRNEAIMIGDDVEVSVVDVRGDKVRLGVTAPRTIQVHRKEVYDAIRSANPDAPGLAPGQAAKLRDTPSMVEEDSRTAGGARARPQAPRVRVYVAMSLDGYIAASDGGVDWLEAYPMDEFEFESFSAQIAVTVMGRRTFDEAVRHNRLIGGVRTIVITHRPIDNAPEGVEAFRGDVAGLCARLRGELAGVPEGRPRDVWLSGGGQSILPFHQAGLVDRWELFVAPILLGHGIPLFPEGGPGLSHLNLTHLRRYERAGFVELWYEPWRA